MKASLLAFFAITGHIVMPAAATELTLAGYQRENGAITVHFQGERIDPYFATKALLAAHDTGLDVQRTATAWIGWALRHQRSDGRFDRFCIKSNRDIACASADADDAMMAVWVELLIKLMPSDGMPPAWTDSMRRANDYLEKLYDKRNGIYLISKAMPVGLLMDNIEIHNAFKTEERFHSQSGNLERAQQLAKRSEKLRENIVRVFWQPHTQRFRVSTQKHTKPGFYPDEVAQIFHLVSDLSSPHVDDKALYDQWMTANRNTWFKQSVTDYPWGLVALAADRMGDRATVGCWLAHARPLRHGQHWNVLEEALYQALEGRIASDEKEMPSCKQS